MNARVQRVIGTLEGVTEAPPVRYAQNGDVHIAYQVVGEGERDLVLVQGFVSHLDMEWESPGMARFIPRACIV